MYNDNMIMDRRMGTLKLSLKSPISFCSWVDGQILLLSFIVTRKNLVEHQIIKNDKKI